MKNLAARFRETVVGRLMKKLRHKLKQTLIQGQKPLVNLELDIFKHITKVMHK